VSLEEEISGKVSDFVPIWEALTCLALYCERTSNLTSPSPEGLGLTSVKNE
jgi:hypothetical protein